MLPNINRLTKKKDFDIVFKGGDSIKADFLICKMLKNQLKESRFGFVVSKKVSGKATVRNAVKRKLRRAVQTQLAEIKKAADVVVIALPQAERKDFFQIQGAISAALKKAKLI